MLWKVMSASPWRGARGEEDYLDDESVCPENGRASPVALREESAHFQVSVRRRPVERCRWQRQPIAIAASTRMRLLDHECLFFDAN